MRVRSLRGLFVHPNLAPPGLTSVQLARHALYDVSHSSTSSGFVQMAWSTLFPHHTICPIARDLSPSYVDDGQGVRWAINEHVLDGEAPSDETCYIG